mmetsp:Transcript_6817/g.10684  ORF Transcript_6817/g.10684 Transcript_6817/m.10684 type:complete len:556 (-) Transcript_6817:108-1775(-)
MEIPSAKKETFDPIVEGLKKIYKEKIRPLEEMFKFDGFHSPLLNDSDIEAKPMVLLLGQYSTGKTSFVKYLLGRDFPGAHIGPEPTTDRFMAIMHGKEERRTPGNALSVETDKPFRGLSKFGTMFLQRFESSESPAPLLEHLTFIDTPGVLSGEKQRIARGYDFISVIEWFAEKADMILLLFDAYKLDISDEFKRTIEALRGNDDKIRVVLNKADQINTQQLMRVYGALMWALGKVVRTPEVMRVYIGSFWNEPYRIQENAKLFQAEQQDLLRDLQALPRLAAVRKCNEMVKRAKMCRIHAFIIAHLRKQMPSVFGQKSAQAELIKNLEQEFSRIQIATQMPAGDFPDAERFRERLALHDLKKFPKLDKKMLEVLDQVLQQDLPLLLRRYAQIADESPQGVLPPLPALDDSPRRGEQMPPAAPPSSARAPPPPPPQSGPSPTPQYPGAQMYPPQYPQAQASSGAGQPQYPSQMYSQGPPPPQYFSQPPPQYFSQPNYYPPGPGGYYAPPTSWPQADSNQTTSPQNVPPPPPPRRTTSVQNVPPPVPQRNEDDDLL